MSLPASTAPSSRSTRRRVLAEVTDGLLTARSSGPLPRLRLVFSRTSGVPVSSLLIKLGLLVSVFPASAPCLFLNIGISPGLCPRQAALPVLQLSPEQT